jgi:alpha-amylase
MKKYFSVLALSLGALVLASCGNDAVSTTETVVTTTETTTEATTETTTTTKPTPTTTVDNPIDVKEFDSAVTLGTTSGDYDLADNIQDGTILHAWNWSYNTIKENLPAIAQSGYSAVQTSPVQQSKSSAKIGGWKSEWFKLYQPAAFSIAADSYLGTKEELAEMCEEAEKYGIKVIVDIVSNHLGNNEQGDPLSISDAIGTYEPELVADAPFAKYFHSFAQNVSDDSALTVCYYSLSNLPDLNTSNKYVQERVASLLKECIDCGVDGFRFDAAKHIETPDDGDRFGSDFWPTILGAASEYSKEKFGKDMYYYGEILNTCGGGRNYSFYTKYMSVTDSKYSDNWRKGLNATATKKMLGNTKYSFSGDGTKAVVWAESHDTFADGTSATQKEEAMNRVYAFEASRGGATPLYFARPNAATGMGDMGSKAWKSAEIGAVNRFHNDMMGENETISYQPGFVVTERGDKGMVIISTNPLAVAKNFTVNAYAIKDGTYYDQVTGTEVVVSGGVVSSSISACGIMVLEQVTPTIYPAVSLTDEIGYFYDDFLVRVDVTHATSMSYSINGGDAVTFNGSSTMTLEPDASGVATLTITAYNGELKTEETYRYYQVERKEGYVAISGLRDLASNNYLAWVWPTGKAGHWEEVAIDGNVAYIKDPTDASGNSLISTSNYLLCAYPKDFDVTVLYGTSEDVWSQKTGQTADYSMNADVIEVSTI